MWDTLSKEAQRNVIATELSVLVVRPTELSGGWFDAARLEPRWHDQLPHIDPPPVEPPVRMRPVVRDRPSGPNGVAMLTTAELCEQQHLSPAKVARLVRRGDLRPVLSHRRRFFPADLKIDYPATLRATRHNAHPRTVAGQLTLAAAATYLNIGPAHFRRIADIDRLAIAREGRRYWFQPDDLDRWLEARRVAPLSLSPSSAGQHRHRYDLEARFDALKRSKVTLMPSDDVWLSTQDAAKRLGITPRTLYRFIDQGEIPAYRLGRVIRLKVAEVDEFIEASKIEPGTLAHLYPDSSSK